MANVVVQPVNGEHTFESGYVLPPGVEATYEVVSYLGLGLGF